MIKKAQILFILLLCSCMLYGQSAFKITNYNSNQGLSNSSVYDIIKDDAGFLWISTELGINKFDGKNFKKYTPNSHNLPDNTITNSTVIDSNNLFFSTGTSGYFTFDIKKEKANPIPNKKSSFLYKSHDIKTYKKQVYIVSIQNDYISVFDFHGKIITDTIRFNNKKIYSFNFDEKGILVAATETGLQSYYKRTIQPYELKLPGYISQQTINTIAFFKEKVFFSNGTTLFAYDKSKEKIIDSIRFSKTPKDIRKLFIDNSGNAWFSTRFLSELFYYNFTSKQLINFEPFVPGNDNSITSIIQDNEDNIWVGSYNSGLYKISPSVFSNSPALSTNNVYKLLALDSTKYLLAIKSGLNILDTKTKKILNLKFDQEEKDYIYDIKRFNNKILIINQIHNNKSIQYENTKLLFIKGRSICLLNDSLALVGAWASNIELVSIKNNQTELIRNISLERFFEKRARVNCFLRDQSGNIWCGTDFGLLTSNIKNIYNFQKINEPLLNTQILDIIESKRGEIMIATNKGLFKYSINKLEVIKELNGHPIEKINSLCKDNNNNIYVGTLNGLFKIKPNLTSEYFNTEDGLSLNEINQVVFNPYKNSVLIGTNQGLCEMNLHLNKYLKKYLPHLQLDNITSSGKIVLVNGVYELEKRNINIRFSSICFTHSNSISFKWIIDNGPERFVENPIIELAAMNYGKHNIKIYASNDGMNWSKPIEINFMVNTPFYFTLWFLILVGTLFCFLVWLYLRYRIKKIRVIEHKKTEIEQKILALKYEALNASINPHFIFNALSSVQHYINTNRNDEASDYLAKFGHLIRQTLESADEYFISLEQEKQRLSLYVELEQLRFNNSFTFHFTIEESINNFDTKIPNMLLQPLIENAIIHGFKQIDYKGALSVRIFEDLDSLKIIIDDNGRGFTKTSTHTSHEKTKSIGMQNVRERLAAISGAVFNLYDKADYSKEHGVIIEITLPLIY